MTVANTSCQCRNITLHYVYGICHQNVFFLNLSWYWLRFILLPDWLWFGLWCLTSLLTIFQLYRDSQFYCWRKPEYPEKTTELPQVTDELEHIMLYLSGVQTHSKQGILEPCIIHRNLKYRKKCQIVAYRFCALECYMSIIIT